MTVPTLTVFTPTYNRADTIPRAFESLTHQTSTDFRWLVVDDGSTDSTRALIQRYQASAPFDVVYMYQENSGKHNAHNAAVASSETELFLILDSDDELLPRAVEVIIEAWLRAKSELPGQIAGVWTLCTNPAGEIIGSRLPQDILDATLQQLQYVHKISQEMLPCFATAVLRRYPFPTTRPGQCSYIPEGYVWSRITQNFPLRFLNVPCRRVYLGATGLTAAARSEYRVGACVVYAYLRPLSTDFEWFWHDPRLFLESAVQAARYGVFSGQFWKLSKMLGWSARTLLLSALPVGLFLVIRDWASGRIAKQLRLP